MKKFFDNLEKSIAKYCDKRKWFRKKEKKIKLFFFYSFFLHLRNYNKIIKSGTFRKTKY